MLAIMDNHNNDEYWRIQQIKSFSISTINLAEQIFNGYRKEGVLFQCKFSDSTWNMTDQKGNRKLDFRVDDIFYRKNIMPIMMVPKEQYMLLSKTYLALQFGMYSMNAIVDICREFRKGQMFLEENWDKKCVNLALPRLMEFLSMIPTVYSELDMFINRLQDYLFKKDILTKSGGKRELATMLSYFNFDEIIKEYWATASNEAKLLYYPLYLWWVVTAILPLRVTEFLMTPRDCLRIEKDNFYLTIRRTTKKGPTTRATYKIDSDYKTSEYRIPKEIANLFEEYTNLTRDMVMPPYNLLFTVEPFTKEFNSIGKKRTRGYFTMDDLKKLYNNFMEQVVIQEYGMEIIEKGGNILGHNAIEKIDLGDLRHIASISAILNTGSLSLVKEMAGHSSISSTSHYCSNMDTLVSCIALNNINACKKSLQGIRDTKHVKESLSLALGYSGELNATKYGFCKSKKVQSGDISDCLDAVSSNGEVGYCPNCNFFRDSKGLKVPSLLDLNASRKNTVEATKVLFKLIEKSREDKGAEESLVEACQKLKVAVAQQMHAQYISFIEE